MKLPSNPDVIAKLIQEQSDRIEGLRHHIKGLEENISILTNHEKLCKQNLAVLKERNIIAIASEFKKVKENLRRVEFDIGLASTDLKNSKFFLVKSEKLLLEIKDHYAMILETHNGKVLTGNFGHKD